MKLQQSLFLSGALALILFATGCDDKQKINVYRAPKEEPPAPAAPGSAAGVLPENHPSLSGMPPTGGTVAPGMSGGQLGELTGTPPAGWEPLPPTSMRLASFTVKGEGGASVDISLIVLGSAAGGPLDNVNRWLSQLGQPAVTEDKLAAMTQKVAAPLGEATIVDLAGLPAGGDALKDGRIIAAMIPGDGKTFFFKLRGNSALATAQKTNFVQWVQSVRISEAPAPTAPAAMPQQPAMAAVPAPAQAPAADAQKPQVKWEVPDGWKPVPATSMRYASFSAAGANGETADISVSMLTGDGGGDLPNVNRWRGQIGLGPVAEGDLKGLVAPVTGKAGEIQTVDMTGTGGRVMAGWVHHEGSIWFFKLSGPEKVAGGEKEKFTRFLQSIEF